MENIKLYKETLGVKTSEELLGLPKTPDYLCSDIDNVLSKLKNIRSSINYSIKILNRSDDDVILSTANDIDSTNDDIDLTVELENIRHDIELLRDWGQSWKDLACNLLNNLDKETFDLYLDDKIKIVKG